jgi:hypothetical protein
MGAASFFLCLFIFGGAAVINLIHSNLLPLTLPCYDVACDMLRDGGRVFSPTRHAAFKRRQCAAGQNKENLARPRPVLRPMHNAACWLLFVNHLPKCSFLLADLLFSSRALLVFRRRMELRRRFL